MQKQITVMTACIEKCSFLASATAATWDAPVCDLCSAYLSVVQGCQHLVGSQSFHTITRIGHVLQQQAQLLPLFLPCAEGIWKFSNSNKDKVGVDDL
jgi:hypothetical protein